MAKEFAVACPHLTTGGVQLLYQFTKELRENGVDAYLYDYMNTGEGIDPAFAEYGVEYRKWTGCDLLVPEIQADVTNLLKGCRTFIYWMGIDWYDKDHGGYRFPPDTIHLIQSQYAWDWLLNKGFNKNNMIFVSDYINDGFIRMGPGHEKREKIVLYNPTKGVEFTRKVIGNDIKFKPLKGLSRYEMIKEMQKAMLYIDFGEHPGKDRIPREAATCGCCVITGRRGSAAFFEDVSIPEKYKFPENVGEVREGINFVLDHYDECFNDFAEYREKIKGEKKIFKKQVKEFVKRYI